MEIIRRNTDYALRALLYLAVHPGVVSAGEIAEREEIPIDFLQKIMQKFGRHGLVSSHRGAQGGFTLVRDPREVTLLEVVEMMQGKLAVNRCFLGKDGCPRASRCSLKHRWSEVEGKIADFIDNITLQDLVEELNSGSD